MVLPLWGAWAMICYPFFRWAWTGAYGAQVGMNRGAWGDRGATTDSPSSRWAGTGVQRGTGAQGFRWALWSTWATTGYPFFRWAWKGAVEGRRSFVATVRSLRCICPSRCSTIVASYAGLPQAIPACRPS